MKKITREFMEEGLSKQGGWNRKQIEILGVERPPRKGWRREVEGKDISDEVWNEFLSLKNVHLSARPKTSDNLPPPGFVLVPIKPSLAMLDAGWGICGTKLSPMQPNDQKMIDAFNSYALLIEAAKRCTPDTKPKTSTTPWKRWRSLWRP